MKLDDRMLEAWAQMTGNDPRRFGAEMSLHDQRKFVGEMHRALIDKGFSWEVVLQMCIGFVCFLADNAGIPRAKVADAVVQLSLKDREDVSLIVKP